MRTKNYSIALPLFGVLLLSGCVKNSEYDVPRLMNSNFEQAKKILGKPNSELILNQGQGDVALANWKKQGKYVIINYSFTPPHVPSELSFVDMDMEVAADKQSFLDRLNLKLDDPHFQIYPIAFDKKKSKFQAVYVKSLTEK